MKPLLQSDIERAMKYTRSNMAASRYLNVHYSTYKRYAKRYFNDEGKCLFDIHLNPAGKSIVKITLNRKEEKYSLDDILENKHPGYALQRLKNRLINRGLIIEKCELCGMEEKRITDMKMPLLLAFKDEEGNYNLENLEILCYNCYFLTVGNIVGRRQEEKLGNVRSEDPKNSV